MVRVSPGTRPRNRRLSYLIRTNREVVQEGHLSQYVQKENEKTEINPRAAKKANKRERPREIKEEPRGEKQRERSRSPQRRDIRRVGQEPSPMISFDEKEMRYEPPRHDEPISADMEPYARKLYGFVGEQVEIRGGIKLETTFGERSYTCTILILYTVVDMEASYNVIMGRLALNKLGAIVSTYHLCMKYPMGKEVGRVWVDHRVARHCYKDSLRIGSWPARADRPDVNVLDLDLDPRCEDECERPLLVEDLKEINIGTSLVHKTKIGTALTREEESNLISFL
ncbi:hypothetical protein CR513_32729, partial [Mucuna pruriens]